MSLGVIYCSSYYYFIAPPVVYKPAAVFKISIIMRNINFVILKKYVLLHNCIITLLL